MPFQLKDTYWALCLPPTVGVGFPAFFSKSQEAYSLFCTRLILQILMQSLCLRSSERRRESVFLCHSHPLTDRYLSIWQVLAKRCGRWPVGWKTIRSELVWDKLQSSLARYRFAKTPSWPPACWIQGKMCVNTVCLLSSPLVVFYSFLEQINCRCLLQCRFLAFFFSLTSVRKAVSVDRMQDWRDSTGISNTVLISRVNRLTKVVLISLVVATEPIKEQYFLTIIWE